MTSLAFARVGTTLSGAAGALIISGLVSPPLGFAQSASSVKPKFEVASIRPAAQPPDGRRCARTSTTDAARVERGCTSLEEILRIEIGIPKPRLVAPDWIEGQRFDISAKLPDGANLDHIPQMFQSLLEDRFGFAFHRESRERPVYALVVAKAGLKVQPAAPESAQPAWVAAAANNPISSRGFVAGTRLHIFSVTGSDGVRMSITETPSMGFVWRSVRSAEGIIRYEAPSITFEGLADLDVLREAQVMVVQDGLKKLGLQLEPRKAPVELFVIDRLEKMPTEN